MAYDFTLFNNIKGISTGHLCNIKSLTDYHPKPQNGKCSDCFTTTVCLSDKVKFTDIGPGFKQELRAVFKLLELSVIGLDHSGRVNKVSQTFSRPIGPIGGYVITSYSVYAYKDEKDFINFLEIIEWRKFSNGPLLEDKTLNIEVAPIKINRTETETYFTSKNLSFNKNENVNKESMNKDTKFILSNEVVFTEWFWLQT